MNTQQVERLLINLERIADALEEQNKKINEVDKTLTCIDAELNDLMGDGYTIESICANLHHNGDDDEARD